MNVSIKNNSDINDLARWIDDHLEMELSVDIVAKKAGYSKWYLQRLYKYVIGIPLGRYIRDSRLTNAAEELRSTTESVTTIAFKYQFDSQQTFTRAFTRRFGISPVAYRKLAKEEVRWNG
ncbi:helix-turn-helix domain-containing protein [Escherichia coli]|uniref:Transposon Tn10 TetD protein n=1 Tax=Escherichia coli TaxID=562 RepID=A0A3P5DKM3_ECOLX|nr:helix-turn-helix domain-containing protein [Escherichia coli]MCW4340425.1 helix-turn-helix domain-containing protein [Klebsiella pneumoniae]KQJ13603.1 transcriptional regulator [Escherichia coli]KSY10344.1 transcriptional regulator [Escherichia coli]MCA6787613.1 helix-turn-helix domain-containing protein [Escherichia coli]MCF1987074.1 helix-turn-helix domain-containing protein [Escherichia coli]